MNEEGNDIEIQCKRKGKKCEGSFIWSLRDQEFYREKGFGKPKNCRPCRTEIKAGLPQNTGGYTQKNRVDGHGN